MPYNPTFRLPRGPVVVCRSRQWGGKHHTCFGKRD
jgi:hypothetical protein